ncbi:MAG: hypothetical protein LBI55_00615 [Oscillospiraceae bacterium]|jgi:cell division protein FtsB|nr:hypothetical protein [Oscillospiraceae bacterium]
MVNRKNLVELRKTKNKNGLNKGLGLLGKGSIAACLSAAALLNAFGEIPANALNTYRLIDGFGKSQLSVRSEGGRRPAVTTRIDDSTESVLVIETDRKMNLKDERGSLVSIVKSVWGCDTDEEADGLLRKALGGTGGGDNSELLKLRQENLKLKAQINKLKSENENIKKINKESYCYVNELIDKSEKAQLHATEITKEMAAKIRNLEDERNQNRKKKSSKQFSQKQKSHGNADTNGGYKKIEELSEQIVCLENQLEKEKDDGNLLREEVQTHTRVENSLIEQNRSLRQEIESLKTQINFDKKRQYLDKSSQVSSGMIISTGNDEVKALKKQVLDLKQKLEGSEQKKSNLICKFEENKLSEKKKISKMKNQLNQLNNLNDQLKLQNDKLLKQSKHQKAPQTSGGDQNCEALKAENEELKGNLNRLKFIMGQNGVEENEYRTGQLKNHVNKLETENVKLKNLVQETNEENFRLQSQLKKHNLSKSLDPRKVSRVRKNEGSEEKKIISPCTPLLQLTTTEHIFLNGKKNKPGKNSSRPTLRINEEQFDLTEDEDFDGTASRYQVLEEENKLLEQRLRSALEEIKQLKESHWNENEKFYKQSEEIKNEIKLIAEQNSKLKKEVSCMRKETNKELQTLFENNLSIRRKLENKYEENMRLKNELRVKKEEFDGLKNEAKKLHEKNLLLEQCSAEALESINQKNSVIDGYNKTHCEYEKRFESYVEKIKKLKTKNKSLAEQNKLFNDNLQFKKQSPTLTITSSELITTTPNEPKINQSSVLLKNQGTIATQTDQLSEMSVKGFQPPADEGNLSQALNSLSEENKQLKQELCEAKKKLTTNPGINEAYKKNNQLNEKLKEMIAENNQLRQELSKRINTQPNMERLINREKELDRAVQKLTDEVNELKHPGCNHQVFPLTNGANKNPPKSQNLNTTQYVNNAPGSNPFLESLAKVQSESDDKTEDEPRVGTYYVKRGGTNQFTNPFIQNKSDTTLSNKK